MKQFEIIRAYKIIERLENKQMPLKVSYALYQVKLLLQPQYDFQLKQEQEVYNRFEYTQKPDGKLDFGSKEKAQEFMKAMSDKIDELSELEVDLGQFKKPQISVSTDIELSTADIMALELFVEFID